jgi:hypothetical protein
VCSGKGERDINACNNLHISTDGLKSQVSQQRLKVIVDLK